MAEKEVQASRLVSASSVANKKSSGKVPLAKASTSSVQHDADKQSASVSSKDPPLREVLEVLRVMNSNVVAQGERLNKQDERMNQMFGQLTEVTNQYTCENYDESYDEYDQYDGSYDFENDSQSTVQTDSPAVDKPKSIFKVLSDKFNQSETLDIPVHPDLAILVNSSFRTGLSDDKYDELVKEIHRPENCDSLTKTRVNQGIWRLLKSWTQTEDNKLSGIQGVLLKATINVVKLMEKMSTTESEHLELGTTAIALLGHGFRMINLKRKDLHKNDLDYKYHYLASSSLPYTDLLYGDDSDVNNNVREINNMNKIGKSMGRGGGPMRGHGRGARRGRFNPYHVRGFRGGRGRGNSTAARTQPSDVGQSKNQKPQKK